MPEALENKQLKLDLQEDIEFYRLSQISMLLNDTSLWKNKPTIRSKDKIRLWEIKHAATHLLRQNIGLIYYAIQQNVELEKEGNFDDIVADNNPYYLLSKAEKYLDYCLISADFNNDLRISEIINLAIEISSKLPTPVKHYKKIHNSSWLDPDYYQFMIGLLVVWKKHAGDQGSIDDLIKLLQKTEAPKHKNPERGEFTIGIEIEQELPNQEIADMIDQLQLLGVVVSNESHREMSMPPALSVDDLIIVHRLLFNKGYIVDRLSNYHINVEGIKNAIERTDDMFVIHLFLHSLGQSGFFSLPVRFDSQKLPKPTSAQSAKPLIIDNYSTPENSPISFKKGNIVEFRELVDHFHNIDSFEKGIKMLEKTYNLAMNNLEKWDQLKKSFFERVNIIISKEFGTQCNLEISIAIYQCIANDPFQTMLHLTEGRKIPAFEELMKNDTLGKAFSERFGISHEEVYKDFKVVRYVSDLISSFGNDDEEFQIELIKLLN